MPIDQELLLKYQEQIYEKFSETIQNENKIFEAYKVRDSFGNRSVTPADPDFKSKVLAEEKEVFNDQGQLKTVDGNQFINTSQIRRIEVTRKNAPGLKLDEKISDREIAIFEAAQYEAITTTIFPLLEEINELKKKIVRLEDELQKNSETLSENQIKEKKEEIGRLNKSAEEKVAYISSLSNWSLISEIAENVGSENLRLVSAKPGDFSINEKLSSVLKNENKKLQEIRQENKNKRDEKFNAHLAVIETTKKVAKPKNGNAIEFDGQLPPKRKLIIFDIDNTLHDINNDKLKNIEHIYSLLKYAKDNNIEVALATNRKGKTNSSDSVGSYSVEDIVDEIEKNTGLKIKDNYILTRYTSGVNDLGEQFATVNEATSKRAQIGKNFFLDEARIRYNQENQLAEDQSVKENQVVFIDDESNVIYGTKANSNYQVVAATSQNEIGTGYLSEIAYQLGAYNDLILFLKGERKDPPNLSEIPIINTLGFKDNPIAKHVSPNEFMDKLSLLTDDINKQNEYKKQFIFSALEYHQKAKGENQLQSTARKNADEDAQRYASEHENYNYLPEEYLYEEGLNDILAANPEYKIEFDIQQLEINLIELQFNINMKGYKIGTHEENLNNIQEKIQQIPNEAERIRLSEKLNEVTQLKTHFEDLKSISEIKDRDQRNDALLAKFNTLIKEPNPPYSILWTIITNHDDSTIASKKSLIEQLINFNENQFINGLPSANENGELDSYAKDFIEKQNHLIHYYNNGAWRASIDPENANTDKLAIVDIGDENRKKLMADPMRFFQLKDQFESSLDLYFNDISSPYAQTTKRIIADRNPFQLKHPSDEEISEIIEKRVEKSIHEHIANHETTADHIPPAIKELSALYRSEGPLSVATNSKIGISPGKVKEIIGNELNNLLHEYNNSPNMSHDEYLQKAEKLKTLSDHTIGEVADDLNNYQQLTNNWKKPGAIFDSFVSIYKQNGIVGFLNPFTVSSAAAQATSYGLNTVVDLALSGNADKSNAPGIKWAISQPFAGINYLASQINNGLGWVTGGAVGTVNKDKNINEPSSPTFNESSSNIYKAMDIDEPSQIRHESTEKIEDAVKKARESFINDINTALSQAMNKEDKSEFSAQLNNIYDNKVVLIGKHIRHLEGELKELGVPEKQRAEKIKEVRSEFQDTHLSRMAATHEEYENKHKVSEPLNKTQEETKQSHLTRN